jgi:hypothetical protein
MSPFSIPDPHRIHAMNLTDKVKTVARDLAGKGKKAQSSSLRGHSP